ncbi:MAG: DNA polymerase III subunit beta [bacterium]
MEFKCDKESLYQGVQRVERIVSTRSTLPIIGNILLEASKTKLKISANNLEIGMEVFIQASIEEEGAVLVPAKIFAGIVSKLPDTEIIIKTLEKGIVKISYKQSNFNINGLSPDEFPALPKVKEGKSVMINAKLLSEMIDQTVFSVSMSEDKYVLSGVLTEFGKSHGAGDASNLRMISTDGYRLSKRASKIAGISFESSVIVPAKALAEVGRTIQADPSGEVEITLGGDHIAFKHKDTLIVSRLIQGQFPDYRQVIPKGSEIKINMNHKMFLSAVERAAVIASSSANIIRLEVKGGKLHVIASAPDVGNVNEAVEAEIKGGERAQVAFNVRLIIDAMKVIQEEKIVLEISGPLSPGLLRPVGGDDYTYIIMPIRVAETSA